MVRSATHANRGSALEQLVNQANAAYQVQGLAVIQKVPVPTKTPKDHRTGAIRIVRERSTVDYVGAWGSRPIAFDAKMNRKPSFPMDNLHDHQFVFMEQWQRTGGVSFLLLLHEPHQSVYVMPFFVIQAYWRRHQAGQGSSIPGGVLSALQKTAPGRGCTVDYLAALERVVAVGQFSPVRI